MNVVEYENKSAAVRSASWRLICFIAIDPALLSMLAVRLDESPILTSSLSSTVRGTPRLMRSFGAGLAHAYVSGAKGRLLESAKNGKRNNGQYEGRTRDLGVISTTL